MLPGVFYAVKKDGTPYFRSNITYQDKHISLGSYKTEQLAHEAYLEASHIISNHTISLEHALFHDKVLPFDKIVTLVNFRDNRVYIKTPIYLQKTYFEYFLSKNKSLKFDIDDLFYYSSHRIQQRGGHLFVNDYGMQYNILSRYGIKSHGVPGKDFIFANEDPNDYRYSNIIIINPYAGVFLQDMNGKISYLAKIHINGYFNLGTYDTEELAAIAYNKACDLAKASGINKNFQLNYIENLSASEYAKLYTEIALPQKYLTYLSNYVTPE